MAYTSDEKLLSPSTQAECAGSYTPSSAEPWALGTWAKASFHPRLQVAVLGNGASPSAAHHRQHGGAASLLLLKHLTHTKLLFMSPGSSQGGAAFRLVASGMQAVAVGGSEVPQQHGTTEAGPQWGEMASESQEEAGEGP